MSAKKPQAMNFQRYIILEVYEEAFYTSRECFEELTPYLDPDYQELEPVTLPLQHIKGTNFYLLNVPVQQCPCCGAYHDGKPETLCAVCAKAASNDRVLREEQLARKFKRMPQKRFSLK